MSGTAQPRWLLKNASQKIYFQFNKAPSFSPSRCHKAVGHMGEVGGLGSRGCHPITVDTKVKTGWLRGPPQCGFNGEGW